MRFTTCALAIVLAGSCSSVAWARDIYVDNTNPGAKDTNSGTQSAPLQTIQAGITAAQPGDRVIVEGGPYTEVNTASDVSTKGIQVRSKGTQTSPISIIASPPGGVVIDQKAGGVGFEIMFSSYVTISDFVIQHTYGSGVHMEEGAPSTGMVVQNNLVQHVDGAAGDNVAGIYIGGCSNCTVFNNTIDDIKLAGARNQNAAGIHGYSQTNCTLQNNTISNAFTGIFHKRSSGQIGLLIQQNLITNVTYGIEYSVGGAGDPPHMNQRVIENIIQASANGIYAPVSEASAPSMGLTILHNVFLGGTGIYTWGYQGVKVQDDIFHDLSGDAVGTERGTWQQELTAMSNDIFSPDGAFDLQQYGTGAAHYGSLGAFLPATGFGATNVATDPLFVNAAGGDYHLKAMSPAKHAADDGTDIGAYPTGSETIGASSQLDGGAGDGGSSGSGEAGAPDAGRADAGSTTPSGDASSQGGGGGGVYDAAPPEPDAFVEGATPGPAASGTGCGCRVASSPAGEAGLSTAAAFCASILLLGLRRSRSAACAGALTVLSACSSGSSPASSGAQGTDAAGGGPGDAAAPQSDAAASDTGSTPSPDASRGDAASDAASDAPQGVGLSSSYPGDMGIANDPAVVWAELFDEGSITAFTARYDTAANPPGMKLLPDVPSKSKAPASIQLTSSGDGANATDFYKSMSKGYEEWFVRWYAKYPPSIQWHHTGVWFGGYDPALKYPYPRAGLKPAGNDLFSVSIEPIWNIGSAQAQFDTYDYWMNMHSWMAMPSGTTAYYGNAVINETSFGLDENTWVCLEVHVAMNTDPASGTGGVLEVWKNDSLVESFNAAGPKGYWVKDKFCTMAADGTQCTSYPAPFDTVLDLQWRSTPSLQLNYFWPQNYITQAGVTASVQYADMIVATQRVGCIR
jgi:parallel beta-helix repeat protein